jgi:hypothetical protein
MGRHRHHLRLDCARSGHNPVGYPSVTALHVLPSACALPDGGACLERARMQRPPDRCLTALVLAGRLGHLGPLTGKIGKLLNNLSSSPPNCLAAARFQRGSRCGKMRRKGTLRLELSMRACSGCRRRTQT